MEQTATKYRHMHDECEAHHDLSSMEIAIWGGFTDVDNSCPDRWM
jgi:hypothetical protein